MIHNYLFSSNQNLRRFFVPLLLLFSVFLTSNDVSACDTSPTITASNVQNIGGGFFTVDVQVCIGINGSQTGFDLTMGCGLNITATSAAVLNNGGNIATAGIAGGVLTYTYGGAGWFETDDGVAGPCFNMTLTVNGNPENCTVTSTGLNDGCLIIATSWSTTVPGPCVTTSSMVAPGSQSGNTTGGGNTCTLRASEDNIIEVVIPCNDTWTFSLCGGSTWDTYLYLGSTCCGGIITQNDDACGLQSSITTALAPGTYYVVVEAFSSLTTGAYTLDVTSVNPCSPLPVDLLNFNGYFDDKEQANLLSWRTVSESSNDYFEIERSYDGELFSRIGSVDGVGTTIHTSDYYFNDDMFEAGTNYYRLKQVDVDGHFEYSNIIAINGSLESNMLFDKLYPNPTNGRLEVRSFGSEDDSPIVIEIYSQESKLVSSRQFAGSTNAAKYIMDVDHLEGGVYSVLLKKGRMEEMQKLVVLP